MNTDGENKGDFMRVKDRYEIASLALVCEDGTKIPLKDIAPLSSDNLSEEVNMLHGISETFYGTPMTIEYDTAFVNRKVLYKLVYGISNNYLRLHAKITELEARIAEAQRNKERAKSMAEQTRRGHVYIISNIGSFGNNIYKIGMTRRLDPMDRIRELGNASVPFPFDVHAIIFSEDAPSLERELHRAFEQKRVNKINPRKEFFNVTLQEIEKLVRKNGSNIEFIKTAEAKDYRETEAKNNEQNVGNVIKSQYPENLKKIFNPS